MPKVESALKCLKLSLRHSERPAFIIYRYILSDVSDTAANGHCVIGPAFRGQRPRLQLRRALWKLRKRKDQARRQL